MRNSCEYNYFWPFGIYGTDSLNATPWLEMVHTLVPTALTQPSTTTYYMVEENITSLSVCVSCMSDPPTALINV